MYKPEDLEARISALLQAAENWLSKDNNYLGVAIEQTVEEGYFSFKDIQHSILAIKRALGETAIREWADRTGLDKKSAGGQNILCLHAGNLPLVGFQDAFATILSGGTYYGKISRKDPYLLPTFLNELKKTDCFSGTDIQWVHQLEDFEGLKSSAIVFAGSESSVPGVKEVVQKLNIENRHTRYLIRTAHFSIAYLDSMVPRHMRELVEGIFRYGGKGCRSVGIVVSPWSLDTIKCELTDYIEAFWLENPQHLSPPPGLKHRFAYNKAVERPQAWLDHFLLQEGGLEMDRDFICYWVQGDENTAINLARRFEDQVQSIYITNPDIEMGEFSERSEFLSDVQRPPLSWKPDSIDTLEWLIN